MKNSNLDGYIFSIVQNNQITEQSELQARLLEHGHNIPQATLSRRLKKLNIAKVAGTYQIVNPEPNVLPVILQMRVSEFGIIVLHTQPGSAGSLAYYLDKNYVKHQQHCKYVLGTIAGDDTVAIITKDPHALKQTIILLKADFPYLQ